MKIVVCGAGGRMGQAILAVAKLNKDVQVSAALECDGNEIIGTGDPLVSSICDLQKFLSKTDVLIDFTNSDAALKNLIIAEKYKVPVVVGTTGFNNDQRERIREISRNIPIVFSPNMAVGVNILFDLVKIVAKKIPHYNIEIVELHHNKKKDSPSGTAIKLAEIAATSIGKNIVDVGVYGRHSTDMVRKKDEIGVSSIRAGDIVGDHTVYFVGCGERIELTHRAHSRDSFAMGALVAAKWLIGKKFGLYDMSDVLKSV
ncbi:MAG: 4-hydroxy-tetrahydrodipicolinate reductase [Endomicrobium sp.]|jgi:4-hydroxy-tetrahydrodipicolinate reductase|nr:4-hydroxy-tetrahydrodipicolinate reductase [Endomicrobium sp.]